jgi:hypothetical protein
MSKYTKLRIRNRDARNWTIEGYDPGGDVIVKGPYAGNIKKEGWDEVSPIGYFNTIQHAASRMLDEELRRVWPSEGWTGEDMTAALATAQANVLVAVDAALEARGEKSANKQETGFVLEMTAEQAAEVRDSQAPAKTYLRITGGKRFKRTSDETRRNLKPDEAALERVENL